MITELDCASSQPEIVRQARIGCYSTLLSRGESASYWKLETLGKVRLGTGEGSCRSESSIPDAALDKKRSS